MVAPAIASSLSLPGFAIRGPAEVFTAGAYRARLAESAEDSAAAFRLRFEVFNLELNEGLEAAYQNGEDTDEFDPYFDHLIVEHVPSGRVIGTYRLQTGTDAARNIGYYSEREFEFAPYASLRTELVELGRACIHRDHRSFEVLSLLWKGVARYATARGARYLIGCCSLTSQNAREAWDMYYHLLPYQADPALRTLPKLDYSIHPLPPTGMTPKPPKLLRTYLAVGAQICSAPAIDREFKTIDFLTLLDLERLPASIRSRFLKD